MKRLLARKLAFAAGLALIATACTSSPAADSESAESTTLRTITCPSAVDAVLVTPHDCLQLRTPEAAGSARMVNVFVLRMTPTGTPSSDPLLILGSDLGDSPDHGGYGPAPNRVHRVVYVMDPRGSGFSQPSLACAGADSIRAGQPGELPALRHQVRVCRARLEATGIDLTAYGPRAVAADAEALRRALGIESWNIMTLGTSSAYVPAVVAAEADAVRAVVLDSPYPASPRSTVMAWNSLVHRCLRNSQCRAAFPHAATLWNSAASAVARSPLQVVTDGGTVAVDPALLSRFVRSMLAGEGPSVPGRLFAALSDINEGTAPADLRYRLRTSGACLGYRPLCPGRSFSLGAYLAATCSPSTATDSSPAYGDERLKFLSHDPFLAACEDWPVEAAQPAPSADVPTLEMQGEFDPFVTWPARASMPKHFVVVVPSQTHNVLGYDECPLAIRNAWIDAPASPPVLECLAAMPPAQYVTP